MFYSILPIYFGLTNFVKISIMNELFYSVAHIVEDSFVLLLEPIGNMFNYLVIVLGLIGLVFWLRLQKKYTKKAIENGDLV